VTPRPTVRLAVVDRLTHRHSGVFRVWTRKNDTYLAPEDSSGIYKVSLHPRSYRIAFTSEHWSTGSAPNNAPGPGRLIKEYTPSALVDEVEFAWRLAFQTDALLEDSVLDHDVLMLRPEAANAVIELGVWICGPSVHKRPYQQIGPDLPLADGRVVKLGVQLWAADPVDGCDPSRRDHVGSMFEFVDRETPEHAPGIVLRPLDVATAECRRC
jgi:hypothetical protein